LLALRGLQYYYQHRPHEAISYFETALAQRIGLGLTEQALLFLGRSYVAAGRFDEGVQRIEQHQGPAGSSWQQASEVNRLGTLSSMYGLAGDLAAEERHVEHLASAHTITESMAGYIDVTLGYIAYERDDLVTAHMYFERLLGRKFIVSHPVYMFGLAGLIVTALANGSFDVADALVQEAFAFAEEVGTPFLRHQAQGCATRVALGRGDIAAALECAETIEADVHLGLSLALDAPRLTQVCALIAAGDEASYAQADALLHTCLAEIEAFHNIRMQIRALAILALLRQAQQRPVDALQALKHAIRLGEPRGFLRTFLDLGPTRLPLIEALAARGVAPSYLQQLSGDAALAVAFRPPERPMASSLGVNRLTSREHEILVLLADRWSDKEIAERLVISLSTVRKHTTTIYDKLGVHSRRDAVTAAQSLGLLSPP
jgi:LuxR family maltose regulon positive regulatory protein